MDAAQARTLVEAARARSVFCMEAMWTRFLPHVVALRQLIADGRLGGLVSVTADHGQWFAFDPRHRLFAPELGGGALLDLGVYPVSFASMLLGPPSRVGASATMTSTGVDAQTSMLLDHPTGAQAVLTCTSLAKSPCTATVVGTEGRIEIDSVWYCPTSFTLYPRDGEPTRWTVPDDVLAGPGKGLRYQAAEVARCLREGLLESPMMPLDETVTIMATLDEVRDQIGLSYPPTALASEDQRPIGR
jgi:predicted dehydrogenase